MDNYLGKKDNLIWLQMLLLIAISIPIKSYFLPACWCIYICYYGNIRRFKVDNSKPLYEFFRKNLYLYPFIFAMVMFNDVVQVDFQLKLIPLLCVTILPILLYLTNISSVALYLSSDLIKMMQPKPSIYHIYEIWSLLGCAVFEELFFRGIVIGLLFTSMGTFSVMLSGILFVSYHYSLVWSKGSFDKEDFIRQFIFGVLSGAVYIIFNNIIYCIIAHIGFNSIHVLFQLKSLFLNRFNDK